MNEASDLVGPSRETIDVQWPLLAIVIRRNGSERCSVATLRLEPNPRGVGRRMQSLVRRAMLRRRGNPDRDRDPRRPRAVRFGKEVSANCRANSLGYLPSRLRRCSQQGDEFIAAWM